MNGMFKGALALAAIVITAAPASADTTINSGQNVIDTTGNPALGAITRNPGGTLTLTGTGAPTGSATLTNGLLPWASFAGAGAAANNSPNGYTFATISAGSVVPYTGATPQTLATAWGGIGSGGSGTVNYDISSNGILGATGLGRNVNTIRYTGAGATQPSNINPSGNVLTANAIMNAGTGTFFIGGTGGTNNFGLNVTVGTTNELILAAMSADITIRGAVLNSSGGGALTVMGNNTVTITGVSTYTGATTVASGTLAMTGTASINTTSGIAINGANAKYLHTSSVAGTKAITLTKGTLDGVGTIGAVTVADLAGNVVANGNSAAGVLTMSSLTFNGDATANVRYAGSAGMAVTGALTTTAANGTVTVNPTLASGSWTTGLNNLISYGSFSGSIADFTLGTVTGLNGRQTASGLQLNGNNVALNVTGDSIAWSGAGTSNWLTATTGDNAGPNDWATVAGKTNTNFWAGDNVQFNDTYDNTNSGGGVNNVANSTVNINSGNVSPGSVVFNNSAVNYSLQGANGIATGSVAKNGTGSVTIATPNAYAGGTTFNAGGLNVNNDSALGTGAVTIAPGSAKTLDNTSGAARTLAANNAQNWNDDFAFAGSNNLDMGTGLVTIGGANGARTVTVNAGTLSVGKLVDGGTHDLTVSGAGSLILGSTGTGGSGSKVNGTLTVGAGTTVAMNRTGAAGATSGDLTANGLAGSGTIVNGANDARWLFVANAADNAYAGTLANGGLGGLGLNKSGAGNLTLNGPLSYTDTTTVGAGTLTINSANTGAGTIVALGSATGANLVLGNTAALGGASLITVGGNNAGTLTFKTDASSTPYDFSMGSGTTSFNIVLDSAGASTVTQPLNTRSTNGIGRGNVNVSVAGAVTSGTLTINTLNMGAGSTGSNTVLNPGAGVTILVGSATKSSSNVSQTLELAGVGTGHQVTGAISNGAPLTGVNAISLVKSGASKWTLSGNSSYTGTTTVSGGILVINGDNSAATGAVTVQIGATLQGTGKLGGATTVDAAGTLAPGNSIGTLTIAGNLTLNGNFDVEYDGTAAGSIDLAAVSGTLTLGAGSILNLSQLGAAADDAAYIFATYTSLVGTSFGTVTGLPSGYAIDYGYNGGTAIALVSSVPEASAFLFGGLVAAATGVVHARNRRRTAAK